MAGFALIIPADGDRPIRMEPFNHVIVSRRGERFTGLTRTNAMLISDSIGARMRIIRKNNILEELIK